MGRVPGFVKWFVGPVFAVAVGFFVVAPAFRGKMPADLVERAKDLIGSKSPEEKPKDVSPEVSVKVREVRD